MLIKISIHLRKVSIAKAPSRQSPRLGWTFIPSSRRNRWASNQGAGLGGASPASLALTQIGVKDGLRMLQVLEQFGGQVLDDDDNGFRAPWIRGQGVQTHMGKSYGFTLKTHQDNPDLGAFLPSG